MKMGRWRIGGRLLALGALAALAAASPASARQSDEECRCVDRDGNEIGDCTCFRVPRFEALVSPFVSARPRLGISVSTSQERALDARGALVTGVLEDGPADDAGLREDDVITQIDGHSLLEPLPGDTEEEFDLDESIPVQRLLALARELEPGQEIEIEYLRDGESRSARVLAEELSPVGDFHLLPPEFDSERFRQQMRGLTDEVGILRGGRAPGFPWRRELDGLEMVELNPGLGAYFGAARGVLVADVDEDSELGLAPGDVILRVGEREVAAPEDVRRLLASYGDDEEITFRVRRDGRELGVTGRRGR